MGFVKDLKLAYKFILVLLLASVPVLLLGTFFLQSELEKIKFAEKEVIGAEFLEPMQVLQTQIGEYRAMVAVSFLDDSYKGRLPSSQAQIATTIEQLDVLNEQYGKQLEIYDDWIDVKDSWEDAKNEYLDIDDPEEAFDVYEDLLLQTNILSSFIADKSNLILDPDLGSYYLMDAMVLRLPALQHDIENLRGHLSYNENFGSLSERARFNTKVYLGRIRDRVGETMRSYEVAFSNDERIKEQLDSKFTSFIQDAQIFMQFANSKIATGDESVSGIDVYQNAGRVLATLVSLKTATTPVFKDILDERIATSKAGLYFNMAVVLVCLVLVGLGAYIIVKTMSGSMQYAIQIFQRIEDGDYESTIDASSKDEVGSLLSALKNMQSELYRQKVELDASEVNTRVRNGLDNVNASVMLADTEFNIVYLNDACVRMFSEAESDIRKQLPSFDATDLLGKNMDIFHKNPSHQRGLIESLNDSYSNTAKIDGRTFKITANPIFDEENQRLGTVVEWVDLTAELNIESEVEEIVEKALEGDLSHRIEVEGKQGFYLSLSQGINQMLDVTSGVMDEVGHVMALMAEGDLKNEMKGTYQGKYEEMKQNANSLINKLKHALTQIRESSNSVRSAAQEIAQGNADLSQRTEIQAASLEQTAASMEEMTSTIVQNTDNARQADKLSSEAKDIAEDGGEVVNRAISAMAEINDASKRIADIISVIDEIAFQTNLLALNASVEAARAGEQGRGFAVVAGEVRNLAGRSATAAKEIKELIEDSVKKVDEGSKLVDESGQRLHEIVSSVQRVSSIVSEIAAASEEQATGIAEVNKAISQIDDMNQQNSALVEEVAATSESMGNQAGDLERQVEYFDVGVDIRSDNFDNGHHVLSERAEIRAASKHHHVSDRNQAQKPEPIRTVPEVSGSASADDLFDDDWQEF